MKYKFLFSLILFCFVLLTSLNYAEAQNINIDLGDYWGTPSNTFGAASGQTGVWNTLGLGAASNLQDITGTSTAVGATVTAGGGTGNMDICTEDVRLLISDNIYTLDGSWSVVLTGLTNGDYTVYLYGPRNTTVPTGNMLVNGVPVSSITGDSCTFTNGTTHTILPVSITTGTLDISGSNPPAYAGLAGIQLIQRGPNSTAVPTITQWGMIIFMILAGLGAVYYIGRQRRSNN